MEVPDEAESSFSLHLKTSHLHMYILPLSIHDAVDSLLLWTVLDHLLCEPPMLHEHARRHYGGLF